MKSRPNSESPGPDKGDGSIPLSGAASLLEFAIGLDGQSQPANTDLIEQLAAARPELELRGMLGRGGMGVVYKAHHRILGRSLAVKLLDDELAKTPGFRERFEREARLLARLDHPNIVRVHDFGFAGDVPFLTMEAVDGRALHQLRDLGLREKTLIATQLCEALAYAHGKDVLHRDIKPANILITEDQTLKLLDFGLALHRRPSAQSGQPSTVIAGTPTYMAPEQLAGSGRPDARVDVFSTGVVLYQLFTGHLPVGRFPAPAEVSDCGPDLSTFIMRALESDAQLRFVDGGDMLAALRTTLETAVPSSTAVAKEPTTRRPRTWAAVLTGLLGLCALVFARASSTDGEGHEPQMPAEVSIGEAGAETLGSTDTGLAEEGEHDAFDFALRALGPNVSAAAGVDVSQLRRSAVFRAQVWPWLAEMGMDEAFTDCQRLIGDRTHRLTAGLDTKGVPRRILSEGNWGPAQLDLCLADAATTLNKLKPLSKRDMSGDGAVRSTDLSVLDLSSLRRGASAQELGWSVLEANGITLVDFHDSTGAGLDQALESPVGESAFVVWASSRVDRRAAVWFAARDLPLAEGGADLVVQVFAARTLRARVDLSGMRPDTAAKLLREISGELQRGLPGWIVTNAVDSNAAGARWSLELSVDEALIRELFSTDGAIRLRTMGGGDAQLGDTAIGHEKGASPSEP